MSDLPTWQHVRKGGYSGNFGGISGMTTIRGSITIAAGTVTMDNIAIM